MSFPAIVWKKDEEHHFLNFLFLVSVIYWEIKLVARLLLEIQACFEAPDSLSNISMANCRDDEDGSRCQEVLKLRYFLPWYLGALYLVL